MQEARVINGLMITFENMSGQMVNYSKSVIYFSLNTPPNVKEDIKQWSGIELMSTDDKQLGLNIIGGRQQLKPGMDLMSRTKARLFGWKARTLSHAGREVLIKSSLASLPINAMGSELLTNKVCTEIDDIRRNFWWGFKFGGRHCLLKRWKDFQRPAKVRDRDIKKMESMNKALIGKLIWRLMIESNSLWVIVMNAKSMKGRDLQDCDRKGRCSSTWRAILSIEEVIVKHLRWKAADGSHTYIWKHRWIQNFNFYLEPPSNSVDTQL